MGLQCNDVLEDYTSCPELSKVSSYLNNFFPENVLEIGAGLGRVSVFLKNTFAWKHTKFYLLDGNSGKTQIAGVNYQAGNNFYNSLKATYDYCISNGIDGSNLSLLNAEKGDKLTTIFDCCYSFKAFGFHWPINDWLATLRTFTSPNAMLLFELRNPKRYAKERSTRIEKFVNYQLSSIDCNYYRKVYFNIEDEFPVLVLQRTA